MSEPSPDATAGAEGTAGADPAAAPAAAPAPAGPEPTAQQLLDAAMADDTDPAAGDDPAKALAKAQADAERWKAMSRKNEERARQNAKAADELSELRKAQMTEQERLTHERDEALAKVAEERGARLRLEAAATYDLPAEAMDLLRGTTEEEITASAEQLAALINSRAALASSSANTAAAAAAAARGNQRPVESLQPGGLPAGDGVAPGDKNALFRQMAGRTK